MHNSLQNAACVSLSLSRSLFFSCTTHHVYMCKFVWESHSCIWKSSSLFFLQCWSQFQKFGGFIPFERRVRKATHSYYVSLWISAETGLKSDKFSFTFDLINCDYLSADELEISDQSHTYCALASFQAHSSLLTVTVFLHPVKRRYSHCDTFCYQLMSLWLPIYNECCWRAYLCASRLIRRRLALLTNGDSANMTTTTPVVW